MDDLISRAAAIEAMRECWRRVNQFAKPFEANRIMDCIKAVKELPAVETAPVVHGKWQWLSSTYDRTPCEMRYWCSRCKHETITHGSEPWEKFCPACGARMDGEADASL